MKKGLGGDRLGSGKKMDVDLHNYARSTHDKGYIFRTTMSAGTLVPFLKEIALPGDTWDINLHTDVKTHPTVGPLFGSFKVQLDIFQCPIRLYQGQLHNNKLGIGLKMANVKLPFLEWSALYYTPTELEEINDVDNSQVNPSSILSYMGIRGFGILTTNAADKRRYFNGIPLLAYWDIYKNYYANKQEEVGAVVHSEPAYVPQNVNNIEEQPSGVQVGVAPIPLSIASVFYVNKTAVSLDIDNVQIKLDTLGWVAISDLGVMISNSTTQTAWSYKWAIYGSATALEWKYTAGGDIVGKEINVAIFPLQDIDTMRERILAHSVNVTPFDVFFQDLFPYKYLKEEAGGGMGPDTFRSIMESQEGLAIKTYQSDLFNNWLSTEWIDGVGGINEITAIDTSSGSFDINTFLLAKKVYDILNRIAVSGGSYDDWLDAVWTHDRYVRCESPMYMGGLIKELEFQEVVSNSEAGSGTTGGTQPLGTLAGKGVLGKKHKGGQVTIKVDEPSYIIGIVSLTPRIDYSQGNEWDMGLKTMDDLHKPGMDEIGFQELITEQMAWWDTYQDAAGGWIQRSAGKQPAWINYMTNVNKVKGNFAIKDNEMFMVNTRRYEPELDVSGDAFTIKDLTTYIDPKKYNYMFAQTTLDSQNFWTQIGVDATLRAKISAKLIPNL